MQKEHEVALRTIHHSCIKVDSDTTVFLACPNKSENYYALWARDAAVTSIGVLQSNDDQLIATAENSWELLQSYQTKRGRIPAYIDLADKTNPRPEYDGWGRILTLDPQMWFVITAKHLFKKTQNAKYVAPAYLDSYKRALDLLENRATESSNLVDWPISAGWDDQMQRRHHVLSLECLRVLALDDAAELFEKASDTVHAALYRKEASQLRETLRDTFWLDQDKVSWIFANASNLYGPGYFSPSAEEIMEFMKTMPTRFFASYLAPYEITPDHLRFDTYANTLAILSGVATQEQSEKILDFVSENRLEEPWPVRVLDPVIEPGDRDHHPFFEYGRNKPYAYQNGGIWPHITGLYILANKKMGRDAAAEESLDSMIEMVKQPGHSVPEWGFNEYYHGKAGLPGLDAQDRQAWSAGGLLYALAAVAEGKEIL